MFSSSTWNAWTSSSSSTLIAKSRVRRPCVEDFFTKSSTAFTIFSSWAPGFSLFLISESAPLLYSLILSSYRSLTKMDMRFLSLEKSISCSTSKCYSISASVLFGCLMFRFERSKSMRSVSVTLFEIIMLVFCTWLLSSAWLRLWESYWDLGWIQCALITAQVSVLVTNSNPHFFAKSTNVISSGD